MTALWDYETLSRRVDRVVADEDRLHAAYLELGSDEYFRSGWRQLNALGELWNRHAGRPLTGPLAIADYACHYGRLLRWLRGALPEAALTACDIDAAALAFCSARFSCEPFQIGWATTSLTPPPDHDLVLCLSLITHTDFAFARALLALWRQMLRPGGLLLVTFLGEGFIEKWRAGLLDHYAPIEPAAREAAIAAFWRDGHAFSGFASGYSEAARYGIGFIQEDTLRQAVEAQEGLALREIIPNGNNAFGQDLAVIARLS